MRASVYMKRERIRRIIVSGMNVRNVRVSSVSGVRVCDIRMSSA